MYNASSKTPVRGRGKGGGEGNDKRGPVAVVCCKRPILEGLYI